MATPSHKEIYEKALEMWHEQKAREGDPAFALNPEFSELAEGGFVSSAVSELMRADKTISPEWQNYAETLEKHEKNPENFEKKQKSQVSNFESRSLSDILQDAEFLNSLLRGGLCIFGASGTGKTILAKTLVKTLSQKGIIFYVLDPSRAWIDLPFEVIEVSKERDVYEWCQSTSVFDTSHLSVRDKLTFTNTFCGTLLESHRDGLSEREILVLEESELYLQNNILRSKKCENVLSLISMGRNFNLRYIALSQAPALLDKLFLKLCELKFYGFLSEPNDLNYLKKLVGKTWIEQITKLDIGEFVFQNKRTIQKVKVDLKQKQDRGFSYGFTFPTIQGAGVR